MWIHLDKPVLCTNKGNDLSILLCIFMLSSKFQCWQMKQRSEFKSLIICLLVNLVYINRPEFLQFAMTVYLILDQRELVRSFLVDHLNLSRNLCLATSSLFVTLHNLCVICTPNRLSWLVSVVFCLTTKNYHWLGLLLSTAHAILLQK